MAWLTVPCAEVELSFKYGSNPTTDSPRDTLITVRYYCLSLFDYSMNSICAISFCGLHFLLYVN
jgi:hypothetical protein